MCREFLQKFLQMFCDEAVSCSGRMEVKKQDRYSYYYVHLGVLHDYLIATKKFENME